MTRDDGYTRYTMRIPTPLYERVKAAAGEKSVNAEIVAALEDKYPEPKDLGDVEQAHLIVTGMLKRLAANKQISGEQRSSILGVIEYLSDLYSAALKSTDQSERLSIILKYRHALDDIENAGSKQYLPPTDKP